MFGFLRGHPGHTTYRQAYARLCQVHRRVAGLSAAPFLSYEGVFLYLLAVDAGWIPAPDREQPRCCRLKRCGNWETEPDTEVAAFCIASGLYLLQIKLEDDIRDSGSWAARLAIWWYRRPIAWSLAILRDKAPTLETELRSHVERHLGFEQHPDSFESLGEYAEPTGEAFGLLFAALAGTQTSDQRLCDAVRDVGREIGRALILFDCASDWWRDSRRGEFNPVSDAAAAEIAMGKAADAIARAGWMCQDIFGTAANTAELLRYRWAMIESRSAWTDAACRRKLERAGLDREPGYTYAFCDGCDCGACGCGGCDGCDFACFGCGDVCGHGVADANIPDVAAAAPQRGQVVCCGPFDCCLCFDGLCSDSRKSSTKSGEAQPGSLVGRTGITHSRLIPTGYVILDGHKYPARTAESVVGAGQTVTVVEHTTLGLIVKPVDSAKAESQSIEGPPRDTKSTDER
jgi:hypothetical protein